LEQLNAICDAAVVAEEQKKLDKTLRTQLTNTKHSLDATRAPSVPKQEAGKTQRNLASPHTQNVPKTKARYGFCFLLPLPYVYYVLTFISVKKPSSTKHPPVVPAEPPIFTPSPQEVPSIVDTDIIAYAASLPPLPPLQLLPSQPLLPALPQLPSLVQVPPYSTAHLPSLPPPPPIPSLPP
jgi:hypothetical protein